MSEAYGRRQFLNRLAAVGASLPLAAAAAEARAAKPMEKVRVGFVDVTYPAGGETVTVNDNMPITWSMVGTTSGGVFDLVNILYTTNIVKCYLRYIACSNRFFLIIVIVRTSST